MAELPIGQKWAATGLLILTLLVGGGNLYATHASIDSANAQNAAQRAAAKKAGREEEQKLCHTLSAVAKLTPPPGSATTNPSRGYEQQLHAVLARLGPDIGCKS